MFPNLVSKIFTFIFFSILLSSCAHREIEKKKDALISFNTNSPMFEDHLPYPSLVLAIKNSIGQLKKDKFRENHDYTIAFTTDEYVVILETLLKCGKSFQSFQLHLNHFLTPFQVYGKDKIGEILLTSYYEPLLQGSLKKTKNHSIPLYNRPKNLVEIKMSQFQENLYGEIETKRDVISAQLTTDENGDLQITPLPSREEIDFKGALKGKNLEIVWVDPIEAFFLHIQGSGRIQLENGKSFTVGYHGQNGMKYEAIGKFLKDDIPIEKMSLQAIEEVLRTKYKDRLKDILSLNPSYIFFKKIDGRARTTLGPEVTDRRTVAVDSSLFSLGLIGHLQYPQLQISDEGAIVDESKAPVSHFIVNQDTGGAIKSAGRADLFWGSGNEGKLMAGHMRHPAKLTYFLPQTEVLTKIRNGQSLACLK